MSCLRRAGGAGLPSFVRLGGPAPPARLAVLFLAVALLTVPIFAHGCHGDDADHEPGVVPVDLGNVRTERHTAK